MIVLSKSLKAHCLQSFWVSQLVLFQGYWKNTQGLVFGDMGGLGTIPRVMGLKLWLAGGTKG